METPDSQKTISTLNTLIEALKDGEKGYQQVADATHDADLKKLFGGYAEQRHEFAKELQQAAFELGELVPATLVLDETGTVIGKIEGEMRDKDVQSRLDWLLAGRQGKQPKLVQKNDW